MNKQTLLNALQDAGTAAQLPLPDLEKLVAEFPYFQTARLLLAKKAVAGKLPDAGSYLAVAATYASKRAVVYELLYEQLPEKHWENSEYDPLNDVEAFKTAVADAEHSQLEGDGSYTFSGDGLDDEAEGEPGMVESEMEFADTGFSQPPDDGGEVEPEVVDDGQAESEIEVEETSNTEEIAEEARRKVEEQIARLQAGGGNEGLGGLNPVELDEEGAVQDETSLPEKEVMQQLIADDLEQLRSEVESEAFDEDAGEEDALEEAGSDLMVELKKKVDDYVENRQMHDAWRTEMGGKNENAFDDSENSGGIVLSNSEESAIRDFVSKQKNAEMPEPPTDPDTLLSETMAKAYSRQGYLKEAIELYEQLSLKNPDKLAYFAAKIEQLKNKL